VLTDKVVRMLEALSQPDVGVEDVAWLGYVLGWQLPNAHATAHPQAPDTVFQVIHVLSSKCQPLRLDRCPGLKL